jgi:hypothetical protein
MGGGSMKVGDRVRVKEGYGNSDYFHDGKEFTIRRIKDGLYVFPKETKKDNPLYNININKLKLIQEDKMKDTISLRELIEQGACKEGLLWFLHAVDHMDVITATETRENHIKITAGKYGFSVKKLVQQAKQDNHPEYITWLKDHGYDDKQDKINELESELREVASKHNEWSAKIMEIEGKLEELKK